MNNQGQSDYRASLRAQLELTGPPALEMLAGRAPTDASVLLAALQAAGLLDEVTVGEPELRRLRRELLGAPGLARALSSTLDGIDFDAASYDIAAVSGLEQEECLHQLVALAAVAQVGGENARQRVEPVLSHAEACAVRAPERVAPLAPLASRVADQLDLDASHRTMRLLSMVAESADLAPIETDVAAMEALIAGLAASVGRSMVQEWIGRFRKVAEGLAARVADSVAAEPQTASCAGNVPRHALLPTRIALLAGGPDEVALCLQGEDLFLEWDGPTSSLPARAVLEPSGVELSREEDPFVEGTALWSLGWPPPGPVLAVVLYRDGGTLRVPLAGD